MTYAVKSSVGRDGIQTPVIRVHYQAGAARSYWHDFSDLAGSGIER